MSFSKVSDKAQQSILAAFLRRRLHSLTGLFLVLFLFEHLLTNSQAALWIGDDGVGFVRMVNFIHSLPYLPVIELFLLGFPVLVHLALGLVYLYEAHYNSVLGSSKGEKPYFNYPRSRAYTWQRLTAWVLLIAVVAHVVHLRVLRNPQEVSLASEKKYLVTLSPDEGLNAVLDRLGSRVVSSDDIWRAKEEPQFEAQRKQRDEALVLYQQKIKSMEQPQSLVVASNSFGTSALLLVRDVFKNPIACLLYTVFVLCAVYHAMNGFWTAMISWGWAPGKRIQNSLLKLSHLMMVLLAFLGLSAIWLSYWVNLLA